MYCRVIMNLVHFAAFEANRLISDKYRRDAVFYSLCFKIGLTSFNIFILRRAMLLNYEEDETMFYFILSDFGSFIIIYIYYIYIILYMYYIYIFFLVSYYMFQNFTHYLFNELQYFHIIKLRRGWNNNSFHQVSYSMF